MSKLRPKMRRIIDLIYFQDKFSINFQAKRLIFRKDFSESEVILIGKAFTLRHRKWEAEIEKYNKEQQAASSCSLKNVHVASS